jgi:hypothetical protein
VDAGFAAHHAITQRPRAPFLVHQTGSAPGATRCARPNDGLAKPCAVKQRFWARFTNADSKRVHTQWLLSDCSQPALGQSSVVAAQELPKLKTYRNPRTEKTEPDVTSARPARPSHRPSMAMRSSRVAGSGRFRSFAGVDVRRCEDGYHGTRDIGGLPSSVLPVNNQSPWNARRDENQPVTYVTITPEKGDGRSSRARFVFMDPKRRSNSLICRMLCRKTGIHFCATYSSVQQLMVYD